MTTHREAAPPCSTTPRSPTACVLALLALSLRAAPAAAVDLTPLLAAPGTTVNLNGTTIYTVDEYPLSTDKTILCNGAQIQSTGGPIRVSGAGVRLVIDNCRISGTGWALLGALSGGQLVVQNGTQLVGNGTNSAIYLKGATLDVDGGSIDQGQWGVQMENSDAALHGVVVTNTMWVIQNVAGAVTLDGGCDLTNLDPVNSGAGVTLIPSTTYPSRAATAVIHDTTFTGFGNAVDIQPSAAQGLPPGTAEIVGCTFTGAVYSALAAVDAQNVRVANSKVVNAKTDGIFFVNSTAVVEDSQVLGSLNSGVTFYGCPDGGLIRNTLVQNTAHQGIAVVVDPPSGRASHGIRVVNNTVKDSAIANLLVDDQSDAIIQGNIFSGAPDMSVRLHGAPSATLIAGLVLDAHGGLEVKDGAVARAALSVFTGHDRYGALVYANGTADFSHCAFDTNDLDPASDDYSVTADTGAKVTLDRCTLGAAGERAYYNHAGTVSTATHDYWGHASGPTLLAGGGGAGAILGWSPANGSRVDVDPFLTTPPVESRVNRAFALQADTTTVWQPDVDVALSLTGAPGIVSVPTGLAAVLRVRDSATLTSPAPPVGTFPDGVVAVWTEFDLVSRAVAGSLRLRTSGAGDAATLSHLEADGTWTTVPTTWDAAGSEVVYSPSDPRALEGVFAFGDGRGCTTARGCLQPLVGASLCDQPLNPKLQRAIARKLRSAIAKLNKAAAGANPPKFIYQARKALQVIQTLAAKFTHAKKRAISAECRDAIESALNPALQRLDAGAL